MFENKKGEDVTGRFQFNFIFSKCNDSEINKKIKIKKKLKKK